MADGPIAPKRLATIVRIDYRWSGWLWEDAASDNRAARWVYEKETLPKRFHVKDLRKTARFMMVRQVLLIYWCSLPQPWGQQAKVAKLLPGLGLRRLAISSP